MTSSDSKVIAVVPAHNESASVADVVRGLLKHVAEVVVVDDRSTDGTSSVARSAGATVISNTNPPGYDNALNCGFEAAAERGAQIFLTFDADGEHDASDVPRILAPLYADEADIVLGQRKHSTHIGERIFTTYTTVRFGIRDPLCGLKAYRRIVYDRVGFFDTTTSIGTELTVRGILRGFRVVCVPITLHARASSTSRFYSMSLRANLKIVRALFRVARLRG